MSRDNDDDPNSVLAPLDIWNLESRGLLSPLVEKEGTRRLHKRMLKRGSYKKYRCFPLNASLLLQEFNHVFEVIPDKLISRATLSYVGFSNEVADNMWHTWHHWAPEHGRRPAGEVKQTPRAAFLQFMLSTARGEIDIGLAECAEHLSPSLMEMQQDALEPMREDFDLENAKPGGTTWTEDMIKKRFSHLEKIHATSRQRVEKIECPFAPTGEKQTAYVIRPGVLKETE